MMVDKLRHCNAQIEQDDLRSGRPKVFIEQLWIFQGQQNGLKKILVGGFNPSEKY